MKNPGARKRAFSLVEVTLALGIAAFSLVVLLGLLPIGLDTNKASAEETSAAAILANMVADMRATPVDPVYSNTSRSPTYRFYIASNNTSGTYTNNTLYLREDGSIAGVPGAGFVLDPATNPRYRVTCRFYPPTKGTDASRTSTGVHLTITWPALGQAKDTTAPPKYARTLELYTTLDRN